MVCLLGCSRLACWVNLIFRQLWFSVSLQQLQRCNIELWRWRSWPLQFIWLVYFPVSLLCHIWDGIPSVSLLGHYPNMTKVIYTCATEQSLHLFVACSFSLKSPGNMVAALCSHLNSQIPSNCYTIASFLLIPIIYIYSDELNGIRRRKTLKCQINFNVTRFHSDVYRLSCNVCCVNGWNSLKAAATTCCTH